MKRVTGIGGIFFKAKDPDTLRAWYRDHLGLELEVWGGAVLRWVDENDTPVGGSTIWSVTSAEEDAFAPSESSFMVNYRVENARALADLLRQEGCNVQDQIDESEFGTFAWVMDPEGNKVELWQPPEGR